MAGQVPSAPAGRLLLLPLALLSNWIPVSVALRGELRKPASRHHSRGGKHAVHRRHAGNASDCEMARLAATEMDAHGRMDPAWKEAGLDAVYVTHYSPYGSRRQYMERALDGLGLGAFFVTGWDREALNDADVACMYPSSRLFRDVAVRRGFAISYLTVGELGLSMKHAAAYYHAVVQGHRNILVLEDDAVFAHGFEAELKGLLLHKAPGDYDVLFLGSYYPNTPAQAAGAPRVLRDNGRKGAVGYLVSQKGARHLVGHMPITGPADHMISNSDYPNAPPVRYARHPWLVWQGSRDSAWTSKVKSGIVFKGDHYVRTRDLLPCEGCACPRSFKPLSKHIIQPGPDAASMARHLGEGFSTAELRRLSRSELTAKYATAVMDAGYACSLDDVYRYEGLDMA